MGQSRDARKYIFGFWGGIFRGFPAAVRLWGVEKKKPERVGLCEAISFLAGRETGGALE